MAAVHSPQSLYPTWGTQLSAAKLPTLCPDQHVPHFHNLKFYPRISQPLTCCNLCIGQARLWAFHELQPSRFQDSRHMKVVRLSALRTGRLYPPGNIPGTQFCQRLSRPQGHRFKPMKNSNDPVGNRDPSIIRFINPPSSVARSTVMM
jgi:hypothetical protein